MCKGIDSNIYPGHEQKCYSLEDAGKGDIGA
jgi:hypothetical protein